MTETTTFINRLTIILTMLFRRWRVGIGVMTVHFINLRSNVLLHFLLFAYSYLCYVELSNCPLFVEFGRPKRTNYLCLHSLRIIKFFCICNDVKEWTLIVTALYSHVFGPSGFLEAQQQISHTNFVPWNPWGKITLMRNNPSGPSLSRSLCDTLNSVGRG